MSRPIYKVLVVDDSIVIRRAITAIVNAHEQLQVVGEAATGAEALALIPKLKPHLVTLDIIMPGMSGLTALKHIMIFMPVPVVMLSSLTQEGARIAFEALRYGAIDFVAKPTHDNDTPLLEKANEIVQKLLMAAKVRTSGIQFIRVNPKTPKAPISSSSCKNIVVIGVAEGGYGSLLKIIPRLKAHPSTAFMVLFYETAAHVKDFIEYLNSFCVLNITRPKNNDVLRAGICYINLGEEYVTVHGESGDCIVHVSPAPFSSRRGSIDMLMFSVAETFGERSLGVILTGAGRDGAEGLEEIVRVGGGAIIQAPVSCLYRSMSLSALNACEAEMVVADSEIATEINNYIIGLQS